MQAALAPSWEDSANCLRMLVTMTDGDSRWGRMAREALLAPVQVLKTADYSRRGYRGGGKKRQTGRIVPFPCRYGSFRFSPGLISPARGTRCKGARAPRRARISPAVAVRGHGARSRSRLRAGAPAGGTARRRGHWP